jgi:hypothetical protein
MYKNYIQYFQYTGIDPKKVSLYLKRFGSNIANYFDISTGSVIKSTNFSNMSHGLKSFLNISNQSNFTGQGNLFINNSNECTVEEDYTTFSFPIKTFNPGIYAIWFRTISMSGYLSFDILLDNIKVKSDEIEVVVDETLWGWVSTNFMIADDKEHILKIRVTNSDAGYYTLIDKICILPLQGSLIENPEGYGPDYSECPYITVHLKMYKNTSSSNLATLSSMNIFDYKTSLNDLDRDDWYNFNLEPYINLTYSLNPGRYGISMSTSGGSLSNYVFWEMIEQVETQTLPIGIRINE